MRTPTRKRLATFHCMPVFKGIFSDTCVCLNAPVSCLPLLSKSPRIFGHASVLESSLSGLGGFQKGGCGGCSPGTKTGTRVRSPKPPFYATALLSPSEPLWWLTKRWFPKGWFRRMFPRNENRNEGTFAKTTLLRNRLFISQ